MNKKLLSCMFLLLMSVNDMECCDCREVVKKCCGGRRACRPIGYFFEVVHKKILCNPRCLQFCNDLTTTEGVGSIEDPFTNEPIFINSDLIENVGNCAFFFKQYILMAKCAFFLLGLYIAYHVVAQ